MAETLAGGYKLSAKVEAALEDTLSLPADQISGLDFDAELRLVKKLRGEEPSFSDHVEPTLMPRGNVSLANGWETSAGDIENGLREMDACYAR